MKVLAIILFTFFDLVGLAQSFDSQVTLPFKSSVVTFESVNTIVSAGINGTELYAYPAFMNSNSIYKYIIRGTYGSKGVCYLIDGVSVDGDLMGIDLDLMNRPVYTYFLSTSPLNSIFYRTDLELMPYITVNEIASQNPYVRQAQRSDRLNIRNGGEEGTLYVVDGLTLMR